MRKGYKISKDDLCYEEEIDEAGFTDYVPPSKNCVSLFSFTDEPIAFEEKSSKESKKTTSKKHFNSDALTHNIDIFDNRTLPIANGSAPSINGEKPTLKRTYKLRPTTIKKLSELIAIHSEPSTYVSTIVDIAIEFYYDFIKNEKLKN